MGIWDDNLGRPSPSGTGLANAKPEDTNQYSFNTAVQQGLQNAAAQQNLQPLTAAQQMAGPHSTSLYNAPYNSAWTDPQSLYGNPLKQADDFKEGGLHLCDPITRTGGRDYFVPMYKGNGEYIFCVGRNIRRLFTNETLPDFVKPKLAMIMACKEHDKLNEKRARLYDKFMFSTYPVDYADIGWRVADKVYTLVLTGDELDSLRGGPIDSFHVGVSK